MNIVYFTESDKRMLLRLKEDLGTLKSGDRIAIKLHMGEVYNPNHLSPDFVKKIVTLMNSMGLKPFLFDSPTKYKGPRHTVTGYKKQAAALGFKKSSVGCPVVISDKYVESKGENLTYQVCKDLVEADGVLVLSHFKGHSCAGVGGAIKNLGMGALTKKSKKEIHEGSMPVLANSNDAKCILCKKCFEVCPTKCIEYDESGPVFNYEHCYGCSKCIQNCASKCLEPKINFFDVLLADGANAALKLFKKVYFVNVLRRIANVCDCSSNSQIVCPDLGILMGKDPCAIDRESIKMVNRRSGSDLFSDIWHKSPLKHIEEAEKLGMGSSEYELQDV